ncbi:hypothetical protein AMTRI_Chr12g241050 [Amborella trichopoda]
MKEVWASLASVMGVIAFIQALLHTVLPPEFRSMLTSFFARFSSVFSPFCYFDIHDSDGVSPNDLYSSVQLYLSRSASTLASRASLSRLSNSSAFTFSLSSNHILKDSFNGAIPVWEHIISQRQAQTISWRPMPEEKRMFVLKMHKKDRQVLIPAYLDHVMAVAAEIRRRNRDRLLYTNTRGGSMDGRGLPWESVPFKHPSTFDTLAMNPAKKAEIKGDLDDFAKGEDFYKKTGRAWKRGYLLYGPPGTGKSSMIAAMANHLGYDIYDLELTEVHSNSELRKLLIKTTSKSIIVIEDIDCSIDLSNRAKKPKPTTPSDPSNPTPNLQEENNTKTVTLSGLLNFTDGLWSCCGSERIFVFTTNHIEKLDPALLRSGRMDMHIFMSYCCYEALKILVTNYLGIEGEDEGLKAVEALVDEAEMTPADISEILIKRRRDPKKALEDLKAAMEKRAEQKERVRNPTSEEVAEEQEKRALETPKENGLEEEVSKEESEKDKDS